MVFKKSFKGTILLIVQRSNGDVFLSNTIIQQLMKELKPSAIDLLVNDDTLGVAKLLPNIRRIFTFSYRDKKENRFRQEVSILKKIYKKYDLSINLTASDRSVLYALMASKNSISAVETDNKKSWWKKFFLKKFYYFDVNKHILLNNLQPLLLLDIASLDQQISPLASKLAISSIALRLKKSGIYNFYIFHPSAQYNYKIYPKKLRDELLKLLNQLNIPIIVTGGKNEIDNEIQKTLPDLNNIHNWIGQTSMDEYLALSSASIAYIGMDTLNMHIAAAQNKHIFAIFGPTILRMWSPWSNDLKISAVTDKPIQTYGNITLFQANMACVACGKAGCNDMHGISDCLDHIDPLVIYKEIKKLQKSV